mmetsp:Transcript_119620/g.284137  ORF Transcript_119620/g.284137 Transcript_119620/m.284137 type:complete len:277 (+) Transcript_119620:772-1602(+)
MSSSFCSSSCLSLGSMQGRSVCKDSKASDRRSALAASEPCTSHRGECGSDAMPIPAMTEGTATAPNISCHAPAMGCNTAPAATPAQEPSAKAAQRLPLEGPRSSASTVSTTYAAFAGDDSPSVSPDRKRSASSVFRSATKKVPSEIAVRPTAVQTRMSREEGSFEVQSRSIEPQRAPQTRELTTAPMSHADKGINRPPTSVGSVSCRTANEVTPPSKPEAKLKSDGNNTCGDVAKWIWVSSSATRRVGKPWGKQNARLLGTSLGSIGLTRTGSACA